MENKEELKDQVKEEKIIADDVILKHSSNNTHSNNDFESEINKVLKQKPGKYYKINNMDFDQEKFINECVREFINKHGKYNG